MIMYVKSNYIVGYNITGGKGGGKSPLNRLIFGSHLQVTPDVSECQSYMGLMYWTYIFRIWKKIRGAYHTFFLIDFENQENLT